MKKEIKKMSEAELLMAKAVCDFHPFARESVLIDKGDMKAPNWEAMLNWEDNFPDWWDEDEDENFLPQKDMTRQERRKATFRKDKGRQTRARDLGYDLSPDMTREKVKTLLSSNHSDRMYFRGNKAKKLGKPMTTIEGQNLMYRLEQEAEEDRESARKEAERQAILDELASTSDDLSRLEFAEKEMTEAISNLIRTIYDANNKLVEYQAKTNGLRAAEEVLRKKISKLEEAVNS